MPKHHNLLIVLADGEHVRFVRAAADNTLHSDTAMDSAAAHKRSSDLASDHLGASFHSGSSARHSIAPKHDPHTLEKEKFAQAIAAQLNAGAADGVFDELLIVAPPHTLNGIRGHLNNAAEAKIVGTVGKDLVKTPDHELQPHIAEWVLPVRRVKLRGSA